MKKLFFSAITLMLLIVYPVLAWIEGGGDATCNTIQCNLTDDIGYPYTALDFLGTTGLSDGIDDGSAGSNLNLTELNVSGAVIFGLYPDWDKSVLDDWDKANFTTHFDIGLDNYSIIRNHNTSWVVAIGSLYNYENFTANFLADLGNDTIVRTNIENLFTERNIFDAPVIFRDNVTLVESNAMRINETMILTDLGGNVKIVLNASTNANSWFNSGGNVGIGITSPAEKLDVNGTLKVRDNIKVTNNNPTWIGFSPFYNVQTSNSGFGLLSGGDAHIIIDSNNNQADRKLYIGKDSQSMGSQSNLMVVQENGNVGIGTTTPSEKLEVNGNFSANNAFFVNENGRVGIGTTSPTHELHVVGDMNLTGILFSNWTVSKTSHEVSDEGLVLAMNFNSESITEDNKALDSSVYNNHGTVYGATHNATGGFNGGGAYEFDGVDDYVDCGNDASLSLGGDLTISLWIKSMDNVSFSTVISKLNNTPPNIGYELRWQGEFFDYFRFGLFDTENDEITIKWTDQSPKYDGQWHHVAVVYQHQVGGTAYVDGSTQYSTTIGDFSLIDDYTTTKDLSIGKMTDGIYNFNGTIDEVRIYNRSLSADEVYRLYLQRKETYDPYISKKNIFVDSSGNVGIGTTSPDSKLEVVGDFDVNGLMNITGSGNNYIAGNVGIGTTSPTQKLDVNGNILIVAGGKTFGARYQSGTDNFRSAFGWAGIQLGNNGNNYIIAGNDYSNGRIIFVVNNTKDMTGLYDWSSHNGTEAMVIHSNGNVGIGTTSPDSPLYIDGNSTGTAILRVKQNHQWIGGSGNYALYVEGYSYLNGFRINAYDPARSLYNINTGSEIGFAGSNADILFSSAKGNQGQMVIKYDANQSERAVRIGNVFGTNGAQTNVEYIAFKHDGTSDTVNIVSEAAGTGVAPDIAFNINQLFLEQSTGNVGIGTTSPTHKLHVVGDINMTGTLYYGALQAQSPHAFMPDDSGMTEICIVAKNGKVVLQYLDYDNSSGKYQWEFEEDSPVCLDKEVVSDVVIEYEDYEVLEEIYNVTLGMWVNVTKIIQKEKSRKYIKRKIFG